MIILVDEICGNCVDFLDFLDSEGHNKTPDGVYGFCAMIHKAVGYEDSCPFFWEHKKLGSGE